MLWACYRFWMLEDSLRAIDTFVDALWLEDGLSRNTLAAYRRDLTLYAQWLAQQQPPRTDAWPEGMPECADGYQINSYLRSWIKGYSLF